jgi:hypothetical protein
MLTRCKYGLRPVALFGRGGTGRYRIHCELDAMSFALQVTWFGGMLIGPWPAKQSSADVQWMEGWTNGSYGEDSFCRWRLVWNFGWGRNAVRGREWAYVFACIW